MFAGKSSEMTWSAAVRSNALRPASPQVLSRARSWASDHSRPVFGYSTGLRGSSEKASRPFKSGEGRDTGYSGITVQPSRLGWHDVGDNPVFRRKNECFSFSRKYFWVERPTMWRELKARCCCILAEQPGSRFRTG